MKKRCAVWSFLLRIISKRRAFPLRSSPDGAHVESRGISDVLVVRLHLMKSRPTDRVRQRESTFHLDLPPPAYRKRPGDVSRP